MSADPSIIAIGDIHGCSKSLAALLKTLDDTFSKDITYVFLGDYTDRGPDSRSVVDQVIEFDKDHECIFLRGNHDQMLLDAYEQNEWNLWLSNGGVTTLKSYGASVENFELPKEHYEFFSRTKIFWETEEYFFVHAGLNPELSIQENLENDAEREQFIWQRDHVYASENNWEKVVIFGHTPVKEPMIKDHMIGIDTGCVYHHRGYGILTAVSLPDMKFFHQESLDF